MGLVSYYFTNLNFKNTWIERNLKREDRRGEPILGLMVFPE